MANDSKRHAKLKTVTSAPLGPVPRRYPLPIGQEPGWRTYDSIDKLHRLWDKESTNNFTPIGTGINKDGAFVLLKYHGRDKVALFIKPDDIEHPMFNGLTDEEREQLIQHGADRLLQPEEWRARWDELNKATSINSLEVVDDGLVVEVTFESGAMAKLAIKDAYDSRDAIFESSNLSWQLKSQMKDAFEIREKLQDGRYKVRDPIYWFVSQTYSSKGAHIESSKFDVSPEGLGDMADEGIRAFQVIASEVSRAGNLQHHTQYLISSILEDSHKILAKRRPLNPKFAHASAFVWAATEMVAHFMPHLNKQWLPSKSARARETADHFAERDRQQKESFVQRMKDGRAKKAAERAQNNKPQIEPEVKQAKRRNGKPVFKTASRKEATHA